MAILAVTQVTAAKVAQTLAASAGGGDSFPNTGKEFLAIKNAGAGSITLTILASGAACNYGSAGTSLHDQAVTVPNDSAIYLVGPFPTPKYNDSNGRAQLTYSGVASVTVAVFSLPPGS